MKTNKFKGFIKANKVSFIILAIAFALILLGSFFAGMVNTSAYSVKVKEIEIETANGKISALLYLPKDAGEDDPRPTVITAHGYTNHKEMMSATAIEMSRRGYVVLSIDMYEHGDSRWEEDFTVANAYGTFWSTSIYDAVQYVYEQPYVKKDGSGNAYIGVSGHSMGGFSALNAMYLDEWDVVNNVNEGGYRKIYAGLALGADFYFTSFYNTQAQYEAAFGSRTVGINAAHYDEFFFAETPAAGNVEYKDYVKTTSGKQFLGVAADGEAEAGKFYEVTTSTLDYYGTPVRDAQSGKRIVYTPNETHAMNTISMKTTENIVSFFTEAFNGVTSESQAVDIAASNQIWVWKEILTLISLIGFFMILIPIATLLLKVPFLRRAITAPGRFISGHIGKKQEANVSCTGTSTAQDVSVSTEMTGLCTTMPNIIGKKRIVNNVVYWTILAVTMLLPAVLFAPLMNAIETKLTWVWCIALIGVAAGLISMITSFIIKKDSLKKTMLIGGGVFSVLSLLIFFVTYFAADTFPLGKYFSAPTVNMITRWAFVVAIITALIMVAVHYIQKRERGIKLSDYGIAVKPLSIVAALCVALVTVIIGYFLVYLMQWIFGVDFRFWTLAAKTFTGEYIVAWFKYVPFFFVYFLVNGIALNANFKNQKGKYALAIGVNIVGLLGWMAIQYLSLIITGVAVFGTEAITAIMLISLIPCIAVSSVYSINFYKKTNNVWLAAFLNAALFTLMLLTTSTLYWNII